MSVRVAGGGGVPSTATAVVMNVTVVTPSLSTYITGYPEGWTKPVASSLNEAQGQTSAT